MQHERPTLNNAPALAPSLEWEDADPTTPALMLPPEYFEPPRLDRMCLAAGPHRALVVDSMGIAGSIAWDVEAGAPVDGIDPRGWVS